jgi:hypothetical protein
MDRAVAALAGARLIVDKQAATYTYDLQVVDDVAAVQADADNAAFSFDAGGDRPGL